SSWPKVSSVTMMRPDCWRQRPNSMATPRKTAFVRLERQSLRVLRLKQLETAMSLDPNREAIEALNRDGTVRHAALVGHGSARHRVRAVPFLWIRHATP